MKRLNPETGKPFKKGCIRNDGFIFSSYYKPIKKDGYLNELWLSKEAFDHQNKCINKISKIKYDKRLSTKIGHVGHLMKNAKQRAKKQNLPFDLTLDYLFGIAPDFCPVFNTKLNWGTANKIQTHNSPSLDKIDREKGYIKGNVRWLSALANAMKRDATNEQLNQFANWVLKGA